MLLFFLFGQKMAVKIVRDFYKRGNGLKAQIMIKMKLRFEIDTGNYSHTLRKRRSQKTAATRPTLNFKRKP